MGWLDPQIRPICVKIITADGISKVGGRNHIQGGSDVHSMWRFSSRVPGDSFERLPTQILQKAFLYSDHAQVQALMQVLYRRFKKTLAQTSANFLNTLFKVYSSTFE